MQTNHVTCCNMLKSCSVRRCSEFGTLVAVHYSNEYKFVQIVQETATNDP